MMREVGAPEPAQDSANGRDLAQLQIRVDLLESRHVPLVAAFGERYWTRPRTESFYRWRYVDAAPFSRSYVAVTDDECFGQICSLRKAYLIDGQRVPCYEIFDWHSLPGFKGSGVGIRVMRALMREGVRLLGIAGTADVLRALPAMGWQTFGELQTFELPLAGDFLTAGLRERIRFRVPGEQLALKAATATWFKPRVRRFDGRAIQVAHLGPEVNSLYEGNTGYDFLQIPDEGLMRWMTAGFAGCGAYRYWYFTVKDQLRGWAVTRLHEMEEGCEASIIEIFAPNPDVALYEWMISELSARLAADRPRVIRARTTCPILAAALRANRYRSGFPVPVHTWPKLPDASRRLHFTMNHTDTPFRPYPVPAAATGFLSGAPAEAIREVPVW
jgi:hypothetical protein